MSSYGEQHAMRSMRIAVARAASDEESRHRIGSYTAGSMDAETRRSADFWNDMVGVLTTQVLANRLVGDEQTLRVQIPATWWQHLKYSLPDRLKRWLGAERGPAWLRRHWKVRYQTASARVSFTKWHTYPKADVPVPSPEHFGYPVIWEEADFDPVVNESSWSASVDSGQVSMSRRYLTGNELGIYIASEIDKRTGFFYPQDKNLRPQDAARLVIQIFRDWGLNPDNLVQRGSIES